MVRERSDTVLPEPAAVRLLESGGFEGVTVGLDRICPDRPGPASGTVPLGASGAARRLCGDAASGLSSGARVQHRHALVKASANAGDRSALH